ncbi:related to human RANBPM NP_005484.1 [Rhynchosporium graminicola]|uniref:Related to human RANBPM NP_005484.1 n=1 Tax=Rhynchosporium graminicola TaxID=2792576 RepID=A0A1E1L6Y3_9HELO|nr:related to human RANBPM NP_005484.1 [Rhynchosporium commune]
MSNSNMPTGASGFVPRRSSYASVVSGTAAGSPHQYSQVMRSGAFAHLAHSEADPGYDHTTYHNLSGHLRHESRGLDMDLNMNGGIHGRAGSWGRGGQLPSFSSAFGPLVHGYGYGSLGGGHVDHFFTPSYLKGSKYVQRLEDAHRAKVAAQKEVHSAQSSQPGSLSTSASSLNLHTKIAPSHRGMTYDLIEKAPPVEDETLAPLPSRWNGQDKYGGLEILSDGQEVKFTGPKSERDRDLEACAIRADHPMPPQCGIYYFEVTILSKKREESSIGIGFSSKNVPLSRLPGWEPESWAYHGDDGQTFCSNSTGKPYGPAFNAGDIIGCGINFRSNFSFFTKNGVHLGTAFRDINKEKLYPSVGMKKSGEHVRVNFGQGPFVYDIDGMMSASNRFSYVRTPFGDIRSDTIPDSSSTSIFPRSIRDGPQPAAVAALQLLNILEDSDDVPPLLPPTPPLRPATSVRVERAGATSVNIIFDSDGTVAATSRRSARTVGLLGILEQQSTERTLLNTERHVIRIAASIDEHRGSLLASIPPVRDSNIHWRRIAASERALDDLVDRVIVRLLPPASLSTAGMSGSYRGSRAEQLYLRERQIMRMRQDFEEIMPRNSIRGRRDEPNCTSTFTDIQIQQEREQIRQQIEATSTAKLASPLDETDLIQSLVLQFLTHEGYVETARAFAGEVYSEKQALSLDPNVPIQGFHVREDEDAGHRNHIRKAVLEGEIDTALKYTQTFYPNVLRDNEHVSFRLKCRKFIEMIRQAAEMLNSNHSKGVKKSNGHNGDWYEDVAHNMDLDDHQSQANNWDRMDTEEYPQNRTEYQQLLEETLSYGKALQAEYKDDPRREINKALEDAFALMAYTDPLIVKEVSHQLDPSGRAAVAEELSSAILLSLGKSSTAALERLIQQSTVLLEELGEAGGPGSFVSIDDFVKIKDSRET